MGQIVLHPLYIRGRKVIESCETNEQLKVAIKYCKLAKLYAIQRTYHPLDGYVEEICDYKLAWDSLIYDANRMLWKSLVEEVKWNSMKCEESTMKH